VSKLWDHITQQERQFMMGVWAIENARRREQGEFGKVPSTPPAAAPSPSGISKNVADQIRDFIGDHEVIERDKKTWSVKGGMILPDQTREILGTVWHGLESPETFHWKGRSDMDVELVNMSRNHSLVWHVFLNIRWPGRESELDLWAVDDGSVFSLLRGKLLWKPEGHIRMVGPKNMKKCPVCNRRRHFDGAWTAQCLPCARGH